MILISVIIPCFNVEEYIEDCINSVILQTYKNTEIICIDNNSTDNTWHILNKLKEVYPFLILDKEEKKGASAARNKGLSLATGTWIQFLDADDILLPEKISEQVNMLKENPTAVLIAGSYHIVDSAGKKSTFEVKPGNKWQKLIEGSLGCTISNLFEKNAVLAAGGWDEAQKSSQEFKLMFDILKTLPAAGVIYDAAANVVYQKRGEGSISSNYKENIARFIELRKKIYDFLKQANITEVPESFYLNAVFQKLRVLYTLDKEKAIIFYKTIFPKGFVPCKSILTPTYYLLLYKLLGFKAGEELIRILKVK